MNTKAGMTTTGGNAIGTHPLTSISDALKNGEAMWSDLGTWTLKNHPKWIKDVSLTDALAVGYLDLTEQGRDNLHRRIRELKASL